MIRLTSDALVRLEDVGRELKVFFDEKANPDDTARECVTGVPGARDALKDLHARFAQIEWTQDAIKGAINALGKERGLKGKNLFHPVRAGVTGYAQGADLVTTARLLGKDKVLANLDTMIQATA